MNFPVTTRFVQTENGSIAILADGSVYRVTEGKTYPPKVERLYSLDEAKQLLVEG